MSIKESLSNYIRILRIAKKPDSEEYFDTFKTCLLGVGVVGTIGFIFYFASVLLVG